MSAFRIKGIVKHINGNKVLIMDDNEDGEFQVSMLNKPNFTLGDWVNISGNLGKCDNDWDSLYIALTNGCADEIKERLKIKEN